MLTFILPLELAVVVVIVFNTIILFLSSFGHRCHYYWW